MRPIARGGMAEVWQAHDETLDRDVAIKMLHPHLADDRDFIERFRREAVAVANLSHPNVVTVYDTGVETIPTQRGGTERRAYLVMELLRGKTLRMLLSGTPEQRPTLRETVRIASEVADGLAYAHRNGVVHRDIKPANIFVETPTNVGTSPTPNSPRYGRVRVVDFGIAKGIGVNHADDDLTQVGSILGTAKYVSPEQVEGTSVDARSDIYSLGVVLYEMVTGRVPFIGSNDMATALQHVRNYPPLPRTIRAGLNGGLQNVIMRALEKHPSNRFPDAPTFAAALRELNPATLNVADNVTPVFGDQGQENGRRHDDATPMVTRTEADRTPAKGIGRQKIQHINRRSADAPTTTVSSAQSARQTGGSTDPTTTSRSQAGSAADPTSVQQRRTSSPREDGQNQRELEAPPAVSKGLRRLLFAVVPLLGIVSGAVVGVAKADQDHPTTHPITYLRAQTFELEADGEHDNQLQFLNDGNRATTWSTSTYPSRNFVRGKPGVGVVLILEQSRILRTLTISTPSKGWNAQVYVSNRLPTDLDGWGDQRGSKVNIADGTSSISIQPAKGTYVLLWITDLGPKTGDFAQVKIAELGLRG